MASKGKNISFVFGIAILSSGCSHHAYVSLTAGQDIRDTDIASGSIDLIPNSTTSTIVGLDI